MTPELIEALREPESAVEIITDKMLEMELYELFITWLAGSGLTTQAPVTPRFAVCALALLGPFIRDHAKEAGKVLPELYAKPYPTASDGHVAYWKLRFALGDDQVWSYGYRSLTLEHLEHARLYYLLTFLQDED